jgi:protoheme IX farnesyltransferase
VNNVLDRDIDARMERTKNRAIPSGRISVRSALVFACILGALGFGLLLLYTNFLATAVTLFGVVVYLCIYTPLKRTTRYSTIVGALAGAVPPVVGYAAVTNMLDVVAVALFLILVCWQMTHFFAISIFREGEYAAAGLPVMSVHSGVWRTKALMIIYALLFALSAWALYVVANLGALYAWSIGLGTLVWIILSLLGLNAKDTARWARTVFFYSIALLLLFCATIAFS